MNDELKVLHLVSERLQGVSIDYMLTGSMALAVYAAPRMTRDIDLVIDLTPPDVDTIVGLFQQEFYIDERSVRDAVDHSGMFNIIHNETIIKVDFIVRKGDAYRIEEFSRRRRLDIDGIPLYVVALEDLVLSKLVWAKASRSELQLRDVRLLLSVGVSLEEPYMERWAGILGVESLLREVLEDA